MFVYKHVETIEYLKKVAYILRKIQTLQENNLRIFRIENAKFSGYFFKYELEQIGRFSNLYQCTFNCIPSLLFFQLFIFIKIDTQWIDLVQFIEIQGNCLFFVFFYVMKHIHGGLIAPPRPPAKKLTHENFACVNITIGNSIL